MQILLQVKDGAPVDVVVAAPSEIETRSSKILLAWILGLPVVCPSWLEACQLRQRAVSMDGHYTWQKPGEPWQGLKDRLIYIHGANLQRQISSLLQFAGKYIPYSRWYSVWER